MSKLKLYKFIKTSKYGARAYVCGEILVETKEIISVLGYDDDQNEFDVYDIAPADYKKLPMNADEFKNDCNKILNNLKTARSKVVQDYRRSKRQMNFAENKIKRWSLNELL